jgi:hypothetical protein
MLEPLDDGEPGLIIHKGCYHTWNGLSHYIRERITGRSADNIIDADGRIVKKYEDFPAVVRYFACSDLSAHEPEKPSSPVWQELEEAVEPETYSREFQ